MKNNFWTCVAGPADDIDLPRGADAPMRGAVQSAFWNMTGKQLKILSTGWRNCSEEAAKISLERSIVFAIKESNKPNSELKELTKGELMKMLLSFAREYVPIAVKSVVTNKHMNKISKSDKINQKVVDAVIADFINFIGGQHELDYGLYTSDL